MYNVTGGDVVSYWNSRDNFQKLILLETFVDIVLPVLMLIR